LAAGRCRDPLRELTDLVGFIYVSLRRPLCSKEGRDGVSEGRERKEKDGSI